MGIEIVTLGSLYYNGLPISPIRKYEGDPFYIGDTTKETALTWVKHGTDLVSDHVIAPNISWYDLDKAGYIFGKRIQIGGRDYICRVPRVGQVKDDLNEWDDIIDATNEYDNLWHWSNRFFWGQETADVSLDKRAVRGSLSARFWAHDKAGRRSVDVGFRPILEPFIDKTQLSKDMIGKPIGACSSGGTIMGLLQGYDMYDLYLSSAYIQMHGTTPVRYRQQSSEVTVVDLSSVTYLKGDV